MTGISHRTGRYGEPLTVFTDPDGDDLTLSIPTDGEATLSIPHGNTITIPAHERAHIAHLIAGPAWDKRATDGWAAAITYFQANGQISNTEADTARAANPYGTPLLPQSHDAILLNVTGPNGDTCPHMIRISPTEWTGLTENGHPARWADTDLHDTWELGTITPRH